VNQVFIKRQRVGKSASPGDRTQKQGRGSDMTTLASRLKGRDARTTQNAPRKVSTAAAGVKAGCRACVTGLNKQGLPAVKTHRYCMDIL
jgi:hypothetical protein